jgi:hypothetical protein
VAGWWADRRAVGAADELAPYAWRDFTDRMLARRFVAAADRQGLLQFVAGLDGTSVGPVEPVEAADPGDPRVDFLTRAIDGRTWRDLSLARLCVDLGAALEDWYVEQGVRR